MVRESKILVITEISDFRTTPRHSAYISVDAAGECCGEVDTVVGCRNWLICRPRVPYAVRFQELINKLADFYTTVNDAVFIEDLNVTALMQLSGSARNTAEVGWRDLIETFEHHGEKNGCHVVLVPPEGTTKECASCGVSVEKPLWVREHSCPSCGFETDRDLNAAANVLARGLKQLRVGHSEEAPAETATATSINGSDASVRVDASGVVESGSPALNETVHTVDTGGRNQMKPTHEPATVRSVERCDPRASCVRSFVH